MVAADPEADKKLKILIIADNFGQQYEAITSNRPLGLFNVGSVNLIDLTLQWVSSIDADVYIAISQADNQVISDIKNKWKPYMKVEVLVLEACHSFGDVMRAVDKLHLFAKEFVLIENVPTFCSSNLATHLENFKELRKNKTINGKQILGKDNLMTMLCSRSPSNQPPILVEKSNNRLLAYHPEKQVTLSKKKFSTGCLVRSDLKQTGIYFCAPEIITKFSDNIDAQSFTEQIGNILAQDETICEYIYIDILPDNVFADTASNYDTLFGCLFAFLHQKYYPSTFGALHPNVNNWRTSIALQFRENFVFVPQNFEAPIGSNNSVFGGPFQVGEKAQISGCFFGAGLNIGTNCNLSQVIVGRNVRIGQNARIKHAIIEDGVELGDNVEFSDCVILGPNKTNPLRSSKSRSPGSKRLKSTASEPGINENLLVGLRAFDDEIRESIKNSLATEDWSDKERLKSLVLEINSSKLAYNIQMDEVAKHVFLAFLQQPRFGPTLDDMKKLTAGWKHIWNNYYKPTESKTQILHAIEEHVVAVPEWRKYAPNYVLFLYNELELLTDDVIIEWYEALPGGSALKNADFNRLVDWLKEDEEDSDEE